MAPRDDDTDEYAPFPGILGGLRVGNFAGVPPAPGGATTRVPELAIRLSGLAHRIDLVLARDHHVHDFVEAAHDALAETATKLHAIADEITGESGDQ